ncbi:OPT family oligopeptide transporter [Brachyspira murdochii]|uniref:Oligopeptide transporter, OPT family n=1 Tax=Brachyspira murdochii (strain ATCC 51284 / DSM 12563 / 56-150) TaxID=526224 RepID=D5U750_BRAM5|nr:oligopeptide transporter, OPT family [Brachyspira murdochii]ADG72774.1 oligopeptide transporter, OPT family [Brachyspira murdochii DSM 12563]
MSDLNKEARKLSKDAYGGIKGEDYIPFIPSTVVMPEMTGYSIILGILFAVLFAAANTYLGLKVGLTISAGIPGAILATGLFKAIFKRNNILEANFTASLAAVGESIAGGIIFILPALILFGMGLSMLTVIIVTIVGGFMGCYFITPVRKYLIVEEHGSLIYPEAMAQSEVLVIGSEGGKGFKYMITGIATGMLYKLFSGGFGFWKESATYIIKPYEKTMLGIDTLASLLGVGFIIGLETSSLMFAGGIVAWLGLIPLIKYFGNFIPTAVFPSSVPIIDMSAQEVWGSYIRYIGAGAVAMGGFISLARSMPTIISSFRKSLAGMLEGEHGSSKKADRINQDAPIIWLIAAAVFGFLATWLIPSIGGGIIGGILAVIFCFFFAVVSARMVGVIGASNNPVSGMTIATLLIVATIFKLTGNVGDDGIRMSLLVCGIVCVSTAVAGGVAQSLKASYIIGGTPKKIQFGMFIALGIASIGAGATVILMQNAYGIGSDAVPAPQATLMKLIVEGIMTAQLPWTLVIIGAAIAIFCAIAKLPILAVALGLYLPITLSTAIFIGGIVRKLVEIKFKDNEEGKNEASEKGILLASGLVAGDAIVGIFIGIMAALNISINFGAKIVPQSNLITFIIFALFCAWVYKYTTSKDKK